MATNKVPGPNMTPASNMKSWFVQGFCNGELTICGRILIGTAGAVSSVTGPYVSAVTTATGVYRVYVPPCSNMSVLVGYQTTSTWATQANVSTVSPVSGYFDLVTHTAAGASAGVSGDSITFIAHLATSKVTV